MLFTWRLEGNRYYLDYYKQDSDYVNYCDVALEGCYIYRQRGAEIVKQENGLSYVKYTYKYFDETEVMISYSSYLTVMYFTEN